MNDQALPVAQADGPASSAHRAMWFLDRLGDAGKAYRSHSTIHLHGDLQVPLLEDAMRRLLQRHDALRMRLFEQDGEVLRQVLPQVHQKLRVIDLRGLAPDMREEHARRALADACAWRFDLAHPPLVRWTLLCVADDHHVLLQSDHHNVHDGRSFALMVQELGVLYAGLASGGEPRLPPAAAYGDFCDLEQERLRTEQARRSLDAWVERLAPHRDELALFSGRRRVHPRRYRGQGHLVDLTAEQVKRLKAAAVGLDISRYTLFLSVFCLLCARYDGRSKVMVGTSVTHRPLPRFENTVGMFASMLPLVAELRPGDSFAEFARRVAAETAWVRSHSGTPLADLVRRLGLSATLQGDLPFNAVFTMHDATTLEPDFGPGLRASVAPPSFDESSKFDFSVVGYQRNHREGSAMQLLFEYDTDVFDAELVRRMAEDFVATLDAVARAPSQPLADLWRELELAQREQASPSSALRALQSDNTVPAMVRRQAERSPSATAVCDADGAWTYRDLLDRVDAFSTALVRSGVRRGDVVGVCAPRNRDLLAVLLAVLDVGAAYLPLDDSYPAARLAYMVEDSGARYVVTGGAASTALALGNTVRQLPIDCLADVHATPLPQDTARASEADVGLAYLIYTSGSTGQPKGVRVCHEALVNLLLSMGETVKAGQHDRLAAVTTISFDIAALELFMPLVAGGCVHVLPRTVAADPFALREFVAEHGITLLQSTPSMWRSLLDASGGSFAGTRALCGGEALDPALARRLVQQCAAAWNVYGPTETTVWSTAKRLEADGTVTAGRPISGTEVLVLDPQMRALPAGAAGEVYIGGVGLALGYHGREALTAERFVSHPWRAGARLYKTGDRGWLTVDGELVVLGRVDQQVKIRGHRIELGEVEAALAADPAIAAAAVIVSDATGTPSLAAYLVARDGSTQDTDRARATLAERLPPFMLPSSFTWLAALPYTPNGKVDRLALPPPKPQSRVIGRPPTSPEERWVAHTWGEVLGVDGLSADDNFFQIGGHSLSAMKVVARAARFLRARPSVALLFGAPTLHEFASLLDLSREPARPSEKVAAAVTWPLSSQQRALWLGHLRGEDSASNVPLLIRFSAVLEAAAVRRALAALARRHPILAARLVVDDGVPSFTVGPGEDLPMEATADASASASVCVALESAFIARPFQLSHEPGCRALLGADSEGSRLLVVMHHMVTDGWSLQIVADELCHCLLEQEGRQATVVERVMEAASYPAYVEQQARWLESAECEAALQYWRAVLRDAPAVVPLPADGPRSDMRLGHVHRRLEAAVSDRLRARCREHGATSHMAFMAALHVVLSRWCGTGDLVIGMPNAGRTDERFANTVGMFVDMLPIRLQADGDTTLAQLLQHTRERTVAALAHAAPFERIVEAVAPVRHPSVAPLVQVTVNSLPPLDADHSGPRGRATATALENRAAKFDLVLYVREEGQGIALNLAHATPLVSEASAGELLTQLVHALQALCDDDAAAIAHVQLTDRRLASQPPPLAAVASIGRRFMQWAHVQPDATAVQGSEHTLSYAQADSASRWVAKRLRSLAGPTYHRATIAIHMRRSPLLAITMLGAARAGVSFTLLDPALPAARLVRLVATLDSAAIVCDAPLPEELATQLAALRTAPRIEVFQLPSHDPGGIAPGPFEDVDDDRETRYALATSGTTGEPRIVASSLAHVASFLDWHAREHALGTDDRFALVAGLGHDPVMRDVFGAFWCGASLHVPPPDALLSGGLGTWLAQAGVSVLHVTPSLWTHAVAPTIDALPGLRWVCFGGEPLLPAHVESVRARARGASVVNFYGATETPQAVSHWLAGADFRSSTDPLPVGSGTPDAVLEVVDQLGRPSATKELGEVLVLSPRLCDGYLGDAQATAARFIQLQGDTQLIGYRTGDLGRRDPRGVVTLAGRMDRQLKIGGARVDPVEVEATLCAQPQVAAACVTSEQDADGQAMLVAHVVSRGPDAGGHRLPALSLFFFADGTRADDDDPYALYLQAADIADAQGLHAIWTPERHFSDLAAAYPNPAVLSAALATRTRRIGLRAGSVVLPLHHPVRVAEEWAVVDRLSGGRVGVAFASGWVPDDFVLDPAAFSARQQLLHERMAVVRRLWRGEAVAFANGVGRESAIRSLPRPVQPELPVWLTAVGNPATFEAAGRVGAHLLTSMTTQSPRRLARSIGLYRRALADSGFDPRSRHVTLMLHTLVADTDEEARAAAMPALEAYFERHTALRVQVLDDRGVGAPMAEGDQQTMIHAAAERILKDRSLIGSVETCSHRLQALSALDVDEIACLIDFGIGNQEALEGVRRLGTLQRTLAGPGEADTRQLREQLSRWLPSHAVPRRFVAWEAFPTTANGKLDMQALRKGPARAARHERPDEARSRAPAAAQVGDRPALRPLTPLEQQVHQVWCDLLDLEQIDPDDNFFDLGGYSLLIPRVLSRLRDRTGVALTVGELLAHPSVAGLARCLDRSWHEAGAPSAEPPSARGPRGGSSIVALQRGRGVPLVLVAPVGGGLSCYDPLLSVLGTEADVHGLASLAVRAGDDPTTLEALAEKHVDDLRERFAGGPLHLCGWSFGGVLAHEVALRLRDEGFRNVEVTLIDAFPSLSTVELDNDALRRRYELYRAQQARGAALPAAAHGAAVEFQIFVRNHRALHRYRPRRSDAFDTLFTAARDPESSAERLSSWPAPHHPALAIVEMDADHYSVLALPHANRIGQHLLCRLGIPAPHRSDHRCNQPTGEK